MSVSQELLDVVEEQGEAFQEFKDRYNAKTDKLEAALEAERKEREALEARLNRGGMSTSQNKAASGPEFKALGRFVRTGDDTELKLHSVGSDPDGGYFVTPTISASITSRLFDQSPMRRLARVETLSAGDSWEEPDDRGEQDAVWVGESESRSKTDTPKVGMLKIPLEEIYSLVPVTQRLLDDSQRDIGGWVVNKISDKFARTEGTAYVTGNAIKKPKGFLSYETNMDGDFQREIGTIQYTKTGHASAFPSSNPADVLKNVLWSLRAPYRNGAVWQMNSNTASTIDKIKDGSGDYIWRPGMLAGSPDSLLGYEVAINEDMPDLGANEFPIAFGKWDLAYVIVDRPGIKLLRDNLTDKPNVLFYAYRRTGGGLANDDAVKLLKCEA